MEIVFWETLFILTLQARLWFVISSNTLFHSCTPLSPFPHLLYMVQYNTVKLSFLLYRVRCTNVQWNECVKCAHHCSSLASGSAFGLSEQDRLWRARHVCTSGVMLNGVADIWSSRRVPLSQVIPTVTCILLLSAPWLQSQYPQKKLNMTAL